MSTIAAAEDPTGPLMLLVIVPLIVVAVVMHSALLTPVIGIVVLLHCSLGAQGTALTPDTGRVLSWCGHGR